MMQKLKEGALIHFLMNANQIKWRLTGGIQSYLCRMLCKAVLVLHTEAFVAHGDIKPDNVMFTDDFRLIFIDLGHANQIGTV